MQHNPYLPVLMWAIQPAKAILLWQEVFWRTWGEVYLPEMRR